MKMELPEVRPEDRTPLVDSLLAIVQQLLDRVEQLELTVQQLRDENAVLKGQKPKPQIRPSQLEVSPPPLAPKDGKRPGSAKRSKNSHLVITEEVPLQLPAAQIPPGAVFKGHEPYVVQDLTIQAKVTRYLRARYTLPDGSSVLAPLPADLVPGKHFGPNLICYVLDQHHHAHVTQPLLLQQLRDYGIDISSGQLSRILTENQEAFHQEKDEVRRGGIADGLVYRRG